MAQPRRNLAFFLGLTLLGAVSVGHALAQGGSGITSPRDNAVVSGEVLIEGTATGSDFQRYELAFFKEFDPLGDWVVFATRETSVVNGVLAIWDTNVGRDAGAPFYPDGTYRLRLRVVRRDSNYDEFFVLGISLANEEPTPVPTDTPESEQAASPVPTSAFAIPTELPTLTPFPTGTPRPTAERAEAEPPDEGPTTTQDGSFLNLEGEVSGEQIRGGLLLGVKIAAAFFGVLLAYLLLRGGLRFILVRVRSWDIPGWLRDRLDQ